MADRKLIVWDKSKWPTKKALADREKRRNSDQQYLEAMLLQLNEPDARLLRSWHHEILSHTYFFSVAHPILGNAKTQLEIATVKNDGTSYVCDYCGDRSRASREADVTHYEGCAIFYIEQLLFNAFGDDI